MTETTTLPSLVVAIMATDGDELYTKLEQEYRRRMEFYSRIFPSMHYYFMKNKPDLSNEYEVHDDTHEFLVRAEESIVPGLGIKTFKFFEVMADKYDYILRTNISSCFLMDRLYNWLKGFPRWLPLYAGYPEPHGARGLWAFGSGYLISNQVAHGLVMNQHQCVSFGGQTGDRTQVYDDVFVGFVARLHLNLPVIPWPIIMIENPVDMKEVISLLDDKQNIFQLRIKMHDPALRVQHEPSIHDKLFTYIIKTHVTKSI